jgi:hypothetical protein
MSRTRAEVLARRIAIAVAAIGSAGAVILNIVFGLHAGGLWRDEVNSLNVATMASLPELWANLSFDSAPALFFLLLRIVAGVPAAASDGELRAFGVAIGLLVIAAIWLNARWFHYRWPLISLALIAFNPMVIRYADSIRAYGLGMVLALLCLGTMWRFAERATAPRAVAALIAGVLSVHTLYYNSFLLFATCVGACAVCLRRRAYKSVLVILSIGAAAAGSLLVYLPAIRNVGATNFFWKVDFTPRLFFDTLSETLGSALPYGTWVWAAFFVVAIAAGGWSLLDRPANQAVRASKDPVIFGMVTLTVGTAAYVAFLFHLSYMTRPWYYVVFIAFVATCMEIIVGALPSRQTLCRCGCAIVLIALSAQPACTALRPRQTNIDAIARQLEATATADDLILINSWIYGLPFRRYYHGPATCGTIPPVEDLRSQRMDLVYRQMMFQAPMRPVLEKMEETLRAGHTIWLIGALRFVDRGQTPLAQPPPSDSRSSPGGFFQAWSEQAAFVVQNHAATLARVRVPMNQPVMQYENVGLSAIRGWRDSGELAVQATATSGE